MKVFFRRIHLYLGLAAGSVILSCCLTGAILVFEKDLQMALHKKRYYVEAGAEKLSIDSLIKNVKKIYPEAKINGVKIYEDASRSLEINAAFPSKKDAKKEIQRAGEKKSAALQRQPGLTIFINPYTGGILEKYSYRETWFYKVLALHRWLLGNESSIGKLIVGISTFIFLFILITELILWWPKTKNILKQRLKLKWNAGWKRMNHDLHIVFGFYTALFLFIFAFTGLAWSFEWFNKEIYRVTNSPLKQPPPPKSTFIANRDRISFDDALKTARTVYSNNIEFCNITMPRDSVDAVNATVLNKNAPYESATDAVYIDQYSGRILSKMKFSERSLGAKVRSAFKPIHTGSVWRIPSKILSFIVCLLGATFPVTGIIMWINRTSKKQKQIKKRAAIAEEQEFA